MIRCPGCATACAKTNFTQAELLTGNMVFWIYLTGLGMANGWRFKVGRWAGCVKRHVLLPGEFTSIFCLSNMQLSLGSCCNHVLNP